MKTKIQLLLAVLPLALAACAGDPNKEANDAHTAELRSERKQKQEAADDRSDRRVDAADTQQKMTTANATGSGATRDRVEADAKLNEAREVARAKATERLEKADARATELRRIVGRKGGNATTASHDALTAVEKQRAAAKQSIDQLATTPNDGLAAAKAKADDQLDTLEGYVKQAGKEIEKLP